MVFFKKHKINGIINFKNKSSSKSFLKFKAGVNKNQIKLNKMKENTKKLLYTTITSQTISPDGRYLFACNTFGDIASFNIEKVTSCIENISNDDLSDPVSTYKCTEKPISLAFHRDFLIVGNDNGSVAGYLISNGGSVQKLSWKIHLPLNSDQIDVNDLWVDQANDILYAACGNSIYQCSLEDGKIVKELKAHKDYIHSVNGYADTIVSASEDGSVKIWDTRDIQTPTFSLEPHKCQGLARTSFGKWVGSASISKEWLACGGASKLALYNLNHLSSTKPFQIFDSFVREIHVTDFIESDSLLVAGESNTLNQYSLKGDMISEITTSGPAIYSVAWQKKNQRNILAAAGASNFIDVTTNFTYKEATLNFYKKEIA